MSNFYETLKLLFYHIEHKKYFFAIFFVI